MILKPQYIIINIFIVFIHSLYLFYCHFKHLDHRSLVAPSCPWRSPPRMSMVQADKYSFVGQQLQRFRLTVFRNFFGIQMMRRDAISAS